MRMLANGLGLQFRPDFAMASSSSEPTAMQKWINSETNKPNFARHCQENLEARTVAASELFVEGFYRTMKAASDALGVPYKRLRSRIQGHHPVSENGGNATLLGSEEEQEVLCWAHRRITQGHHIQGRALQQHANAILKAKGRGGTASQKWAQRFMKRWGRYFHRRKAASRDVKRKAMQDRACVEAFFRDWSNFITRHDIRRENIWNFDETGFMVGYLNKGTFLWTFNDIEKPVLSDSHETVSVTAIEAISAVGTSIPSFLVLPGVQIPVRWVENALEGDTVIAMSPKGYTNDIIAIEWAEHFERLTRPSNPGETRVLLMDGCDNHHTSEIVHFCHDHDIELFPLPPHLTHYLQPLDVGVFRSYKHWHQQVVYREVADGASDFGKTDFLYHLQEIRNRTFKKHTILSAWEKCGLFPHKPSMVLDNLQDALSSLTKEVDKRDLPGFIQEGNFDQVIEPSTPQRSPQVLTSGTPPTIRQIDWNSVATPKLDLSVIRRYNDYVNLRLEVSILSEVPLTPSVSHVHLKARKAANTLALNGITATDEMRRVKEKQLSRAALKEKTRVIGKYGPLSVYDARVRVARDEYNRLGAKAEEQRRMKKKEARDEAAYLRRWLRNVRGTVRNSIKETRTSQMRLQGGWTKGDRRVHLNSTEWLCYRWRAFRELSYKRKFYDSLTYHHEYDHAAVHEAADLVILEHKERTRSRKVLSLEIDGVEIPLNDIDEASSDDSEAADQDEGLEIDESTIICRI